MCLIHFLFPWTNRDPDYVFFCLLVLTLGKYSLFTVIFTWILCVFCYFCFVFSFFLCYLSLIMFFFLLLFNLYCCVNFDAFGVWIDCNLSYSYDISLLACSYYFVFTFCLWFGDMLPVIRRLGLSKCDTLVSLLSPPRLVDL